MDLIEIQHQYCNEHWWLEQPKSATTLRTFYELNRYKMKPKKAYHEAWSHFRTLVHNLNN